VWTKVARRDLLQDDFNEAVFMRPGQSLTRVLAFLDKRVVDGAVSGVGAMTLRLAGDLRKTQTGYVRSYALLILLGTVAILTAILVVTL
jgi:NADH-quinone oxidoreductase subunit L